MCIDDSSVVGVVAEPGKGVDARALWIERQLPTRVPQLMGPQERLGCVTFGLEAVVGDDHRLAFDLLQHHGVLVVQAPRNAVGGHDGQQAQD
jgi:hypothetical protein